MRNAVARVRQYLKRRLELCGRGYDSVIHVIDSGDPNEGRLDACDIDELLQQRAELLEALKGVEKSLGHMMHPNQKAAVVAAITKAEAAE